MPQTRPETTDFLDRARLRASATIDVDHDADRVFAALADTPNWPKWFPNLRSATWTSSEPHGVGSTRDVRVGPVTISERFIAWEPGRRWGFTFTGTSVPVARAAVEVVTLDDLGDGRTRVTYALGADPLLPGFVARRIRGRVSSGLQQGLTGLRDHLDARAAETT